MTYTIQSPERGGARQESDPALSPERHPQVDTADGDEQEQIGRCVREDTPRTHEPRIATDIDDVRPGHLVEVDEGIAKGLTARGHLRGPLFVVEIDDGVAIWQSHGNDQTVLAGEVSDEVDLSRGRRAGR